MPWLVRALLPLLLLAAACSPGAVIDKMVSAEDRAFAERFVADVRRGNAEGLAPHFDPGLLAGSAERLERARQVFPAGEGTTRLVSYSASTHVSSDAPATTTKRFTLVTTDRRCWTTTRIRTLARGGAARVTEWDVTGSDTPPPELLFYEAWERVLPWIWGGMAAVLIGVVGLVWWLVRRSRRRAASERPAP